MLIGGHSDAALARAARLGDGWMHAGGDGEALASLLGKLRAMRADGPLASAPFEVHAISMDLRGRGTPGRSSVLRAEAPSVERAIAANEKARETVIYSGQAAFVSGVREGHDRVAAALRELMKEAG